MTGRTGAGTCAARATAVGLFDNPGHRYRALLAATVGRIVGACCSSPPLSKNHRAPEEGEPRPVTDRAPGERRALC